MEALAVVDRQLGGAMAEVRRHQSDLAGLTERVEDLRAQLAKAESKLGACRSSLTWWSERLELAQETVTRSATPNALEQAQMRAQDVLRQAHEDRDIIERARRNVRQRSGARPAHVRSEPTAVLTAADGPARYRIPGVPYAIGWVQ
jgi:chromosome segregation ATPase